MDDRRLRRSEGRNRYVYERGARPNGIIKYFERYPIWNISISSRTPKRKDIQMMRINRY